jgi:CubicO group peptidase (beta-lactamase class C family)
VISRLEIGKLGSPKSVDMKLRVFLCLTILVIFGLLHYGCDEKDLCDPTPKFDIDIFVQNVHDAMNDPDNPVAGYQFVVNQNGNLYHDEAGGKSVYGSDDGGPIDMTVNTRMNVASVSKFIGTIALMQVLEKHNINSWAYVYFHLPQSWADQMHEEHYKANYSTSFTFEDMLRMDTGLRFGNATNWSPGPMPTTDDMLRALVQDADADRKNTYQNGNFTLIRVLIGELEYNLSPSAPDYNYQTAEAYFDYIKRNIFDKLNIDAPMTIQAINNYYSTNTFTRGHQYPFDESFRDGNNEVGWAATSNPENNGGSGGLVLSAMDLAKILAYFKHDNGTIISKEARERILKYDLGLWGTGSGDHGTYSSKGGTRGPETGNQRALRSMIMMFPNGVEAVLLVNSNKTNNGSTLRQAFDAAWVNPCN